MTQTCPTPKELRSLVDGSLSDIEAQPLELHIDRCEVCQRALQELAADGSFWKSAADNLSDDKIVGPGLDRVIETLQHQSREEAEEIGEAIELKLSFIEPPVEPGTIGRLRHYDILRVAGRGGMGIVLKAFDRSLRRVVAIKLLAPHLAGNGQARQRFVREGRAAAAISHEHVVTIHAVEESPPFLVMQYVHGETLEARIHRNGSLGVRDAVRIALQIAQGLAAAHAQGVVHRDIKPANILLENGVARVRITDFGLARAFDDASLTQSGVVAGTPQYMAPEQANGDAIDERADLFSLGSVLYTMLAGHAPFRATTAMGVLKRLCDNAARPIKEINPETPDWLVVLINRLHAKRPADRFHSATEVATLLERGLAAMQTGATMPVDFAPPENSLASGRASALRANTVTVYSPPGENSAPKNAFAEQESPQQHAAHSHQPSFIFTDLGAIAKRLLPPFPLWLPIAVLGLAVMPMASDTEILFVAIAIITLLGLWVFRRLTSKPVNGSDDANAETVSATGNLLDSTPRNSFLSIGVLRLFAWSLLWILPAFVWAKIFFTCERRALTGKSGDLLAATGAMLVMTAAVCIAWLVIAFYWFQQKQNDGSPLFSSPVRWSGMLKVAGLAATVFAGVYGVWDKSVYSLESQRIALRNPPDLIEAVANQQYFPVRIEFESAQEGIDVVIENGSPPVAWAAIGGNSRQSEIPGSPGKFPWHATLGQKTFASGEVTLESGKTAVIKVPRPLLIDLIAGRWKTEISPGASDGGPASATYNANLEFEFNKETAVFTDSTSGTMSRLDYTVQIDESVTPASITLTDSNGEKVEGIIRFKPNDIDPRLESNETGMGAAFGMRTGLFDEDVSPPYIPMADRLWICISPKGSPRPSEFKSDPDHGIILYQLIRNHFSGSLLAEPQTLTTPHEN